jgi:ionotropic kainate glutamate receptor 2
VHFGVQAVFGPTDPLLGAHIHSICDALDIPHLEARLDLDSEYKEFSINLHPAQPLLNSAFQDVMAFLNWTKVAIVYEEDYGESCQLCNIQISYISSRQRDIWCHSMFSLLFNI